jgi:Zn-dependent protease with chaperone function
VNFFAHQNRARRRTWLLALLFSLAVAATVLLANLVVLALVAFYASDAGASLAPLAWARAHPGAAASTTAGTLGFVLGASLLRMAALRRGGGVVVRALGGRYVDSGVDTARERQLRNVVEEMAIAAGLPVPALYVLDAEPGINAFAAGYTPSDAAIAVTRGTLEYLTRDELQGVVAHEFSHILNGDMRLNTRLLGVLHGLLVVGASGRALLRGLAHGRAASRRRGGGQYALVAILAGLALVVIGYVGTLFGLAIRAAVARERELLADAAAVQFTRNPRGIAGALKKIAVSPLRAVLQSPDAEEIGHMLIADGRKLFQALFATHPPLLARIRAIEPGFDPAELGRIKLEPVAAPAAAAAGAPAAGASALSPALLVASVGQLSAGALDLAARREAELPPVLVRAARAPAHAPALVLALALGRDPGVRAAQIERVRARLPQDVHVHLEAFHALVAPLDPVHRLPLVEIAFPALRRRTPAELDALLGALDALVRADGRFDVLDYALLRLLRVQLRDARAPARPRLPVGLKRVREDARVLLAVLAAAGGRGETAAEAAYRAGMRALYAAPPPARALPRPWAAALDRALTRLDALRPPAKEALVAALARVVQHDRRITLGEIELLRAVCASLHCPLPALAAPADGPDPAGKAAHSVPAS